MPTPVGHAMAGAAIAWIAEIAATRRRQPPIQAARRAPRSVSEKREHAPSRPAPPAKNGRNSHDHSARSALLGARWALLGRAPSTALALTCVFLATAPDFDLLFRTHRSYSHSIGAASVAGAAGALLTPGAFSYGTRALICTTAYGTHILLDWLGKDSAAPAGLMAFWPFSSEYFHSGLDVFSEVSRRYWRRDEFIVENAKSMLVEICLLAPILILAWILRLRALHISAAPPERRGVAD